MDAQVSVVASASTGHAADDDVVIVSAPAEHSSSGGKKKRARLSSEAYKIFNDYFFRVTRRPNEAETLELVSKVHHLAGCESCRPEQVNKYFERLRARHRSTTDLVVKRELVETPLPLMPDESISSADPFIHHTPSTAVGSTGKKARATSTVEPPSATLKGTVPTSNPLLAEQTSVSISLSNVGAFPPGDSSSSLGSISASTLPPASSTQKRRKRILPEGYKIMDDFFHNVSRNPTTEQRHTLLAVITSMNGCEQYTFTNLNAYFYKLRSRRKEPHMFVKAESPELQSNGDNPPLFVKAESPEFQSNVALHPETAESLPEAHLVPPSASDREPEPPSVHSSSIFDISQFTFVTQLPATQTQPGGQFSPSIPFVNITPYTPTATPRPSSTKRTPQAHITAVGDAPAKRPIVYRSKRGIPSAGNAPATSSSVPILSSNPEPQSSSPDTTPMPSAESAPHSVRMVDESADADASGETRTEAATAPSEPNQSTAPASTPVSKSNSKKRSTTEGAFQLLDNYYANVSSNPSRAECTALASQVNALPGCEGCTAKRVGKHFQKQGLGQRCDALMDEGMGAGAEAEAEMVLVAEVELDVKSDGAVFEASDVPSVPIDAVVEASSPDRGGEDIGAPAAQSLRDTVPMEERMGSGAEAEAETVLEQALKPDGPVLVSNVASVPVDAPVEASLPNRAPDAQSPLDTVPMEERMGAEADGKAEAETIVEPGLKFDGGVFEPSDLSAASVDATQEAGEDNSAPDIQPLPETPMEEDEAPPSEDIELGYEEPNPDDADMPMDVDDPPPAGVQAKAGADIIFNLAMRLERVFAASPSASGEDQPTTFTDFAAWLQVQNVDLYASG